MIFTPLAVGARNRLREHELEVVRTGIFQGEHATRTRCADHAGEWTVWFTETAMVLKPGTNKAPVRA